MSEWMRHKMTLNRKRKWARRFTAYEHALGDADTGRLPNGWECTISADVLGNIILLALNADAPDPVCSTLLDNVEVEEVPIEHLKEWVEAKLEVGLSSLADYIQYGPGHEDHQR